MTNHPQDLPLPATDLALYVRRLSEMRPEILDLPLTDAEMAEGDLTEELR